MKGPAKQHSLNSKKLPKILFCDFDINFAIDIMHRIGLLRVVNLLCTYPTTQLQALENNPKAKREKPSLLQSYGQGLKS